MCLCPLGKEWDVHDGWKLQAVTEMLHENKARVGIVSTMTRMYIRYVLNADLLCWRRWWMGFQSGNLIHSVFCCIPLHFYYLYFGFMETDATHRWAFSGLPHARGR